MTIKQFSLSGAALVALIGAGIAFAAPAAAEPGINRDEIGASTTSPAPETTPGTNPAAEINTNIDNSTNNSADIDTAPAPATEPAEAAAPAPVPATAADANINAASETSIVELPNAAETLASASVQSKDGASVGTVEDVKIGDDGKPEQVKIDLGAGGKLGLAASDLSYDAGSKTLVASLSQSELKSLAAAQKQTH